MKRILAHNGGGTGGGIARIVDAAARIFYLASAPLLTLCMILLCAPLAGCPSPNQDAIAINGAGTIAALILTNDGNPTGAQTALTISGQLATSIKNFVPGSNISNIIQLGDSFVAILRADTTSKSVSEIAIITQEVLDVVAEYSERPVTVDTSGITISAPQEKAANAPPRTKAKLYAAYNAALAANPVQGLKPLK